MKQLILTADDFGRSVEINAAIEEAHRAGFLTQASLMVNEPAVDDAVAIARRNPGLCVGLHLTLCAGRASRISKITDATGRLCPSPGRAGLRYVSPSLVEDLRAEIRTQFEHFRDLGFPATYWDGHAHLHLHPVVFHLTLPIAVEYGFRGTRLVREPGFRSPLALIFWILSQIATLGLRKHGLHFADHVFGLHDTGRMSPEIIAQILEELPDGLSELYFHPSAEPTPLDYPALVSQLAAKQVAVTYLGASKSE